VATAMKAMARVGFPEDWARLTRAKREGTGHSGHALGPQEHDQRSSVHVTMIIDWWQPVRGMIV
jgi:hypothetical protein